MHICLSRQRAKAKASVDCRHSTVPVRVLLRQSQDVGSGRLPLAVRAFGGLHALSSACLEAALTKHSHPQQCAVVQPWHAP